KTFDSSYDRGEPIEFPLTGVIKGWQEAIPLLSKGGKGTFLIPSGLAYGARGAGADIPGNTVLIFDVELLDFYDPSQKAKKQIEADDKIITDYLAENGITDAKKTESGLYYTLEREGQGNHPTAASTVEVHYAGMLMDGTKFDSSYDRGQPAQFPLNRVIPGWTEGVQLLKPGGKARLYIPSSLGYGERGAGGMIPPNAVLMFDVELLRVLN
ncbi:MAG: FKBP-type peptidyl-prolyl cis-trans isomerase, partial [Saprospiraceae bacterium]